jgi:hypothetical protein
MKIAAWCFFAVTLVFVLVDLYLILRGNLEDHDPPTRVDLIGIEVVLVGYATYFLLAALHD